MSSIKEIVKIGMKFIDRNAPTILAVATSLFAAGSVALAIKDTPKAMKIIEEENAVREEHDMPPMTKTETAIKCAKVYLPTAAAFTLCTATNIWSHSIQAKRIAALASAYALSTDQFKKYKEKVQEQLTGPKLDKLKGDIAQDMLDEHPVDNEEIIDTGHGSTLVFDSYCGRYFRSSKDYIDRQVNIANSQLLRGDFYPLNDLYYLLELEPAKMGEHLGWNSNHGGFIEVSYSSKIASDGTPCLVMDFSLEPDKDYTFC